MSYYTIKTSYLHAFHNKTKQKKLKFKGVRNTMTLTRLETLLNFPIFGLNIVLNVLKDKIAKIKKKGKRKAHNLLWTRWRIFYVAFLLLICKNINKEKITLTCGLPPTQRSFNVISLTIKWFLYPIPNLSQRDNDIKLTLAPKSHMDFSMVLDPMAHGMEKLPGSLCLGGNLF